jgi:nicotinate-nucleotide pyrophosphorylase (carboxylating)
MDFRREVLAWLREDRAWSDVTSRGLLPPGLRAEAALVAREPGVVAGLAAAAAAFRLRDGRCRVRLFARDGGRARPGLRLLGVKGPLAAILASERTALNILSHLSGVATLTRRFVDAAGPSGPRILDTRKTVPGLRSLQKWAVRCGGGTNHRPHLAQSVLVKENHLAAVRGAGDVERMLVRLAALRRRGYHVIMECHDRPHVLWALKAGADVLLLDNFTGPRLHAVVRWIRELCRRQGRRPPEIEVSGGVTISNLPSIARANVDRVSVGRLTHSAPALDISLDVLHVDR